MQLLLQLYRKSILFSKTKKSSPEKSIQSISSQKYHTDAMYGLLIRCIIFRRIISLKQLTCDWTALQKWITYGLFISSVSISDANRGTIGRQIHVNPQVSFFLEYSWCSPLLRSIWVPSSSTRTQQRSRWIASDTFSLLSLIRPLFFGCQLMHLQ